MGYNPANPLTVQSDLTVLLEVQSPLYDQARQAIAPFAEILKSPEYVHTYRITPISLWNAAAAGLTLGEVISRLRRFSRFEVPDNLVVQVEDLMARYGRIRLHPLDETHLKLTTDSPLLMEQLFHLDGVSSSLASRLDPLTTQVKAEHRGLIKQALIKEGYPVMDQAGYRQGAVLTAELKESLHLRSYQRQAAEAFINGGTHLGGSGVVVLPCGAGKTVVGMAVIAALRAHTLILVTGNTAARQWRQELLDKTHIHPRDIGEFSGEQKEIRPVTIATYHILTHRSLKEGEFTHFHQVNQHPWGLVVYDEVHLLPAQMFRFTASLQAVRRLGLTATLIREDHKETEVFSLIGPKNYDMGWKEVERQGWIAEARCFEIRIPLDQETIGDYMASPKRQRFRIASENPAKTAVIRTLLAKHEGENVLIIGQYLCQLQMIADILLVPLITGQTPEDDRQRLYDQFRCGQINVMAVSSVANFAIDLPEASVAIQVSGRFGSRQEEAQRLGRILRPKKKQNQASFYTLVSASTEEQDFALNRQLFLTEQGYSYTILSSQRDPLGVEPSVYAV
jgi:DNA excision repair protein ERCC-3